jgi:hypothetical protein
MAALAILRVEKLKSFGSVGGSEAHTARLKDTPNADPTKTNIRLIGNPLDPLLSELVQAKIASECKHKPRKDAVLCSEIFLSASPEYFRPDNPSKAGEWDDQLMWDFANASRQWLLDNYGDKCVRAELHLDEATPHIHAYVVPVNQKTKQLSHKAMFGGNGNEGKQKLSKLQDSYALALAHLGIERGVKGSKATHTKVKEYYEAVNSNPLFVELERLAPQPLETAQQLFERIKANPQIQTINHQLADRQRALYSEKQAQKTARASEKLRQQLSAENQRLRTQLDQLRDLPLEEVAWQLGLTQDAKGDGRWKGTGHIINIDGSKFYDFSPSSHSGGGGAIDLVMHVNSCTFREAMAWLNDRFGSRGMLRAATHHARIQAIEIAQTEPTPQFIPPAVDENQWSSVQQYLIQKRGLPKEMVQALYLQGLVYADSEQNAVFGMRSLTGETTGAFLRGTRGEDNSFMGYARGTKRADGWFYVRLGGQPDDDVQRVVLTKSPIDALSLATIEGIPQQKTMYLVADSAKSLPVEYLRTIPKVIAAYDNDASGFELARAIAEQLPEAQRVRPALKDWNEELLARLRQQQQQNQKQKNRGIER